MWGVSAFLTFRLGQKLGSQAAKAAQAHDFIQNLPNGYHTQIGDGKLLSGGHGKSWSHCTKHWQESQPNNIWKSYVLGWVQST